MRLVADRFVVQESAAAIDLATGRGVLARTKLLASRTIRSAWLDDCVRQMAGQADSGALVDFEPGLQGEGYEWWDEGSAPVGPDPETSSGSVDADVELTALRELLRAVGRAQVREVALTAEGPSGLATWWRAARELRLHGLVPLCLDVLGRGLSEGHLLNRRSCALIVAESEVVRRPERLARWVAAVNVAGAPALALVVTIRCREWSPIADPGRGQVTRVRETAPAFVAGPSAGAAARDAHVVQAGGRTAVVRRGTAGIARLVRRGRLAEAQRRIRARESYHARRAQWIEAGWSATRLAELLLHGGHHGRARESYRRASALFARSGHARGLLETAIGKAVIDTDCGALLDAEGVLRASLVAARRLDDPALQARGGLALARCLYWQARYDEAGEAASSVPAHDPASRSVRDRRLARIAIRAGRIRDAGALIVSALEACCGRGPDAKCLRAGALTDFATLQGAVGDLQALSRHLGEAELLARSVRCPGRLLRVRIVELEAYARLGHRRAPSLARALTRRSSRGVPALLGARLDRALVAAGRRCTPRLTRFVAMSGARALEPGEHRREPAMVEEVIEVLNICQETAGDEHAIREVCQFVRQRLRALQVATWVREPVSGFVSVAGRAERSGQPLGRRIVDTGVAVPVHPQEGGLEAGAPVRYGGSTVAALLARWPIDSRVDPLYAGGVLATAAAAVAPNVRSVLDRAVARAAASERSDTLGIHGTSGATEAIRDAVRRAAALPFPVLVLGESGCGKELVARAIHAHGPRRAQRFCAVNCAALPDELLEAELFGHARGAFTGAHVERPGLFEAADQGTLFLDEVGELSPRAQAKLLRAIQEGETRRLGETHARRVDVRIVAATNRQLREETRDYRFREDLLYRLDVLRIEVPPLRERPDDVLVLAARYWDEAARRVGTRAVLSEDTMAALSRYDWPGNVRELQNVITQLAVRAARRGRVDPSLLPDRMRGDGTGPPATTLERARHEFDVRFVREALARAGGNRSRAAEQLGLSRQGLLKLIARLGLQASHTGRPPGRG